MRIILGKTLLAVSLAAGGVVGMAQLGLAAGKHDPMAVGHAPRLAPTSGVVHKLVSDKIDYSGSATVALAAGFNTIDSTTVVCANAGGCTLTFGTMIQVGGQTATGNKWAICAYVDGADANPGFGCPYQNELATDSSYQVGNSRQNLTVAMGTHTMTTEVYVTSAATLGEWQAEYSVYKP